MITEITTKENANIKYARKLASLSKFRKKENCFFIEGARICEDAATCDATIKKAFYTLKFKEKFPMILQRVLSCAEKSFAVSESVMKSISDTQTPQGIACVCEKVSFTEDFEAFKNCRRIVLLENVQDPSNLGTILRSCDALGVSAVGVLGLSCDIYNPKALRASMGALFRLRIAEHPRAEEFIKWLQFYGFKIYAAVPHRSALEPREADFSGKVGIVLGNEGNGLEENTVKLCNHKLTIPMNKGAESLNVAAAAGILIWEITNRGDKNDK